MDQTELRAQMRAVPNANSLEYGPKQQVQAVDWKKSSWNGEKIHSVGEKS